MRRWVRLRSARQGGPRAARREAAAALPICQGEFTMASVRYPVAAAISLGLLLASGWSGLPALAAAGAARSGTELCSAGAHTLSAPGSHVYPDTGNGGYTSLHTDVRLVYDATSNRFLPGNHVALTERATQCVTNFSLDFE